MIMWKTATPKTERKNTTYHKKVPTILFGKTKKIKDLPKTGEVSVPHSGLLPRAVDVDVTLQADPSKYCCFLGFE
jgi:hypothetical protein